MREITISVPDNFTDEQMEFLKKSAFNQVEAEIMKEAVIPKAAIDAATAKVDEVKVAMGLAEAKPIGIIK
jgi:hypothetical protein